MEQKPKIIINGNEFHFEPDETILSVSHRNQTDIPTLCYLKGTIPTGACRICVVEVEGARTLLPACTTPAANNMVVHTESPKVIRARRDVLDLMLSSGNHNCSIGSTGEKNWTDFQRNVQQYQGNVELCPVWGDCQLQDLAYRYQVFGKNHPETESLYPKEMANPYIIRDFSRCILCGRCVQTCTQIQVNNAIHFGYRGEAAKIVAKGDKPLAESDCVFCGECVQVCPVGALVVKNARNNLRSADTHKVRTTCTYCGTGCQLYLYLQDNRVVNITGAEDILPNNGSLCVRGRFGYDFISSSDRLTKPLLKKNGNFTEITWDDALKQIADKLSSIKNQHGPDSIGVITSTRMTNEENYLASKFTRTVLKTNNIDNRLGQSSTLIPLAEAFGDGAMTNDIGDIESANVILVAGSNTTETNPVISSAIKRAASFKDTQLIVVDPDPIKLTEFADIWLKPKPDTDVAWINGLMHVIIQENLYDKTFVENRTEAFNDLKKTVEKFTPVHVEGITGIAAQAITHAAKCYAGAKTASIFYGAGITQQVKGENNVAALANLAMLCGNIGIKGGGVNPLCRQSNIQGASDMGGLPHVFSGNQPVTDPEAVKRMESAWKATGLPTKPGLTASQMMQAAASGKLKAMVVMSDALSLDDPDLNQEIEALSKCDFLVVLGMFLTETAKCADIILPTTCFAEKEGTFTNTERRVQRVRKAIDPPENVKPEGKIICDIATGMGTPMSYENPESVFNEMRKVTPSYGGITYDRIKQTGLQWPCPDAAHPGTPILYIDQFTRGKGLFHPVE